MNWPAPAGAGRSSSLLNVWAIDEGAAAGIRSDHGRYGERVADHFGLALLGRSGDRLAAQRAIGAGRGDLAFSVIPQVIPSTVADATVPPLSVMSRPPLWAGVASMLAVDTESERTAGRRDRQPGISFEPPDIDVRCGHFDVGAGDRPPRSTAAAGPSRRPMHRCGGSSRWAAGLWCRRR